jgi:DNA-binding NtrC family response regulator
MNLAAQLLSQIDNPTLNQNERAYLRCQLAKELEESGNYEAARGAMGELWQRVGQCPNVEHLDRQTAAEVLLRSGSLSGWIGSAQQIPSAQEIAKNLLSRSGAIFESLGEMAKASEAQIELARCYWHEGAYDEARITLQEASSRLTDRDSELKAMAFVRSAMIERAANKLHDAHRILTEASLLVEASDNHSLKGKFHGTLATVLKNIGTTEQREDYIDCALVEFSAASFHFKQAGHTRFLARVENNLGSLFFRLERFSEAHEHLNRSRRIFANLKDSGSVAQVDDTRARTLLAQGRNSEAERIIRGAVRMLEQGGEYGLLTEALNTQGVALARVGKPEQARFALDRAATIAEQFGNNEATGLATLTFIEELCEHLTSREMSAIYERAERVLAHSQDQETLRRLDACARRILNAQRQASPEFNAPNFIYASEQTATLLRHAYRIATTSATVLITGETGTGKELIAHLIHTWSGRAGQFVALNCGALTETLFESLLFGHKKGSFTDAVQDHAGAVRQAAGGTLFLDEIAELSAGNQGKLLRLIERGEIHTIGSPVPEQIDVRIVAATNRDLQQMIKRRLFREDLFYRLQTFHLEIPPLRSRPEDIPLLAEHFIQEALARYGKEVRFPPETLSAMCSLPLLGNARELRTLIERTMLTATDGSLITPQAIEIVALRQTQRTGFANPWAEFSLKEEIRRFEERFIEMALRDAKGMISVAARLLGFSHHSTLDGRLKSRNKNLQSARKPAEQRKRSIISK